MGASALQACLDMGVPGVPVALCQVLEQEIAGAMQKEGPLCLPWAWVSGSRAHMRMSAPALCLSV